ncbi:MAG: hypothetical protein KH357_11470 [Clostridiales bacterium]|nr:hypothetical protein [Clostridiales bacterium]
MIYYANSKLKKQKLVTWIKKNRTQRYYISMTIQIVLFFIVIGIFCGLTYYGIQYESTDGIVLCLGVAVIFDGILLGMADLIKKKTILRLGRPYSKMESECVNLIDDIGLEFYYHDVLKNSQTTMDVYLIYYEDIMDLDYDEDTMLLTITGKAQLIVYDDFAHGRINQEKSQRRFYNDSKYSFILAFDDAKTILSNLTECSKNRWH